MCLFFFKMSCLGRKIGKSHVWVQKRRFLPKWMLKIHFCIAIWEFYYLVFFDPPKLTGPGHNFGVLASGSPNHVLKINFCIAIWEFYSPVFLVANLFFSLISYQRLVFLTILWHGVKKLMGYPPCMNFNHVWKLLKRPTFDMKLTKKNRLVKNTTILLKKHPFWLKMQVFLKTHPFRL